jgi:hypothetical protein
VECDSKSDTGNNRGDWNYFKITQTIPEQHTWNVIAKVIPVIIGATGIISKSQTIPEQHTRKARN